MKKTMPSITGMTDRKKPFLPKRMMHSVISRQQKIGSRVSMTYSPLFSHIPQQPKKRNTAASTRKIIALSAKKPVLSR